MVSSLNEGYQSSYNVSQRDVGGEIEMLQESERNMAAKISCKNIGSPLVSSNSHNIEGDTVTTAPITTNSSSDSSFQSENNVIPTAARSRLYNLPPRIPKLEADSGYVDSRPDVIIGPFLPKWPGVEDLVEGLCSPIYCVRKSRSNGWDDTLELTFSGFDDMQQVEGQKHLDEEYRTIKIFNDETVYLNKAEYEFGGEGEGEGEGADIQRETEQDLKKTPEDCCNRPSIKNTNGLFYAHSLSMLQQQSNEHEIIRDVEDESTLVNKGACLGPIQTQIQESQRQLAVVPSPQSPLSMLFGEMLCNLYFKSPARHDQCFATSVGSPASETMTPLSIQTPFSSLPLERSMIVVQSWARTRGAQSPMLNPSYYDEGNGKFSLDHWPSNREWAFSQMSDNGSPQAQCNCFSAAFEGGDSPRLLTLQDDMSSVGSSFWDVSEISGCGANNDRSLLPYNSFSPMSIDASNVDLFEESLFKDDELRAFMIQTGGGNLLSPLFPGISSECSSTADEESSSGWTGDFNDDGSHILSDDGLSDEIVALESSEQDLRDELEVADQVIKGVLAKHEDTSKSTSNLKVRRADTFIEAPSDELMSCPVLSIDTASACNTPANGVRSPSLRRVRFAPYNEEIFFFNEPATRSYDEQPSFQEFLISTCEEIYSSFGDFLDEVGCRPITCSTTSGRRPSSAAAPKVSTIYYN